MKITINSTDASLFATVQEVEEGIEVTFYRTIRRLNREVIDQPWHVVLDHVHATLREAPGRANVSLMAKGEAYC